MPDHPLLEQVDLTRLPAHIAIIMDGNGRWAKERHLPRIAGHRVGVQAVDRVVTLCRELGVKALTLYSFSLENWARPITEISALWGILSEFLQKEIRRMAAENIRFNAIGRIQDLPREVQELIASTRQQTASCTGMVLSLALSYGAREELLSAVRRLAEAVAAGRLRPEEIDEAAIDGQLYTAGLPNVDLLIRTSGELRVSNFLLWQLAYAEFFFTDIYWPDFSEADLLRAIIDYQNRQRRFGRTQEQLLSPKS
ncbi:MAG: isoprenyl transferase [Candidatus Tectomicrobia bacterium]|nr:isoprenyl transferase [Candidatus Tectomicrobia bacterium]